MSVFIRRLGKVADAIANPPAVTPAPTPAPQLNKRRLIVGGGRILSPSRPALSDPTSLSMAGLLTTSLHEPEPDLWAESRARWPEVSIGEEVRISNSMFPNGTEYQPGDIAEVQATAVAIKGDDPVKYKNYSLKIISGPRKGTTLMMFRWEFEKMPDTYIPSAKSRVITWK
jgi:hypothetical protein